MSPRQVMSLLVFALALAAAGCGGAGMARPDRPAAPPDPTPEILIPAGEFVMGIEGEGSSSPAHTVYLDAVYLDRHEVTNSQYLAFCQATDRKLPEFWGMDRYHSGPDWPRHPVVGVSWADAGDYAKWIGKRLPSEAEFERAARGGVDGKKFYWGDEVDASHTNYAKSEHQAPVEVESYPPNGFGLHDMSGNVAEWVIDRYDAGYYAISPAENPLGPEKGRFRVIRGGGWHTGPGCTPLHFRNGLPANWVDIAVGFRCARDAEDLD
jgi:sulfatase modifying factor 1